MPPVLGFTEVRMLRGMKTMLRTVRSDELDLIFGLVTDINAKGEYWHLNVPSEREFRSEYEQTGFWAPEDGRLLICDLSGRIVGELFYFKGLDYQSGPEIGYEIFSPADYGKGFVSEALMLFVAWLFAVRPLNRVQVNLMAGNAGSRRVVEKCGFTHDGTMRQATFHNGRYHDLALYSMLREECPPLTSLLSHEPGPSLPAFRE